MALLAKKIGMVRTWPIPMNRSRVFTMHAMIRDSVENSAEPSIMAAATPRMLRGLRLMPTPRRTAPGRGFVVRSGAWSELPKHASVAAVAWRLSASLCSRAYVWVPVARNWHCLAWSHSSVGKEDQLALDAVGLKSCSLSDNSGQRSILAGDGLSANDPKRTLVAPPSAVLLTLW